jgi:hypothetical protein
MTDRYGVRAAPASSDFPDGAFKDESVAGMKDGTPFQKDWPNSYEAFLQGLRGRAGIKTNGVPDTALANQNLTALDALKANLTAPPNATREDICSALHGAPGKCWFAPDQSPNVEELSHAVLGACIGWNHTKSRPQPWFVSDDDKLRSVSGAWDYSEDPIAAIRPIVGLSEESLLDICSDGDYLYILYGKSDGHLWVAKFSLLSWSSSPVATLDLGEYYTAGGTYRERCNICVANDSYLGFSSRRTSAAGLVIGSIPKDLSGSTSYVETSGYGSDRFRQIVSDGSFLYGLFAVDEGGGNKSIKLIRATIPNVSTNTIFSIMSSTMSDWHEWPTSLLAIGDNVITHSPDGCFYLYSKSLGFVSKIGHLGNLYHYGTSPDNEYGVALGFDGKNVWASAVDTGLYLSSQIPCHSFYPIPGAFFSRRGLRFAAGGGEINPIQHRIDETDGVDQLKQTGKLLFDGVDMWFFLRQGKLFRITNPLAR